MITTNQSLILSLMFRPGESVCVSDNQFAYRSVSLSNLINDIPITLISPSENCYDRTIATSNVTLIALNPISGFRCDDNCTAFRNFLVELDDGTLKEQLDYIRNSGLPYSAITFSGNKSLHVLISLEKDLLSQDDYQAIYDGDITDLSSTLDEYKFLSRWILKSLPLSDQATLNPSRSIRFCDNVRAETGKIQYLVEIKGPVKIEDLKNWLSLHPNAKPQKYKHIAPSDEPDFSRIPPWIKKQFKEGQIDFHRGRSNTWFSLAADFSKAGYPMEDIEATFDQFFIEESDFKRSEYLSAINSGYRKGRK